MNPRAAAGRSGLIHEAGFYGSDEEFLELSVPFLLAGLETGDVAVSAFSGPRAALVRDALPDPSAVIVLDNDRRYQRPAVAIRLYRELLTEQLANGVRRVRIAGDVPHAGVGGSWAGWGQYEAVVNHVFAAYPLWGRCCYDVRTTPYDVLDDVSRTHPWVATPNGDARPNADFQDPVVFLGDRFAAPPDPLENTAPVIELVDPRPSIARVAVRAIALACGIDYDEVDELVAAVQEAVVNALVHGKRPVRVRVWVGLQRTVVAVTDRGRGPADPFAGLVPVCDNPPGGFGLWQVHQLCRQVTMSRDEHGFTIRMIAGSGPNRR